MADLEVWVRGRLCRVKSIEIHGADPSVGLPTKFVESAELEPIEPLPRMISFGAADGETFEGGIDENLSHAEWAAIDRAYWDTHPDYPLDDVLTVYRWQESEDWEAFAESFRRRAKLAFARELKEDTISSDGPTLRIVT